MKIVKFSIGIASFFLGFAILISVLEVCCFNRYFYDYEYQKNNTAAEIKMSEDDLIKSMDTLLLYLKNHRDDIVVEAQVDGILREVYNERETLHMKDVKNLYQNARIGMWCCYFLSAGFYIFAWKKGKEYFWTHLKTFFASGIGLFLSLIVAIGIYAVVDFEAFWIQFHEVLFSNDLYLLDPNTSLLIRMVPQSFFSDLVFLIIISYFGIIFVLYKILSRMSKRS